MVAFRAGFGQSLRFGRQVIMEIESGARFVAHYDMLGMSALVRQDLDKAWGAIRQLDEDRQRILGLVIEVSDPKDTTSLPVKHYIRDQIRSFTFSDTIVIYSVGEDEASLRAIIYLCNEIFARALHRRIPLRGGIAHGSFVVYPERNLFVGPPLVEAYRLGEESQWLGTVVDEYTAGRAREVDLRAGTGDPLIVSWRVPLNLRPDATRQRENILAEIEDALEHLVVS